MTVILAGICTLAQQLHAINANPEAYRPERCPYCGCTRLWRHGHIFISLLMTSLHHAMNLAALNVTYLFQSKNSFGMTAFIPNLFAWLQAPFAGVTLRSHCCPVSQAFGKQELSLSVRPHRGGTNSFYPLAGNPEAPEFSSAQG
ncbi:MAG: hypothetical protein L3J26_01255 [Candidatus Polarisedimenticolaceae bacterium]|nr:hypothetical protein [Candidatus Polarisedimenticolaceae bacterium]